MCCGQTARSVTPSLLSSAVPAGQWEITYPSGNARKFPTEWQAEASRAVGGGSIKFIPAEEPAAEESAAEESADVAQPEDVTAAAVPPSTSTPEPAAATVPPKPTPPRKATAAKPATRTRKAPATPRKPPAKPSGD